MRTKCVTGRDGESVQLPLNDAENDQRDNDELKHAENNRLNGYKRLRAEHYPPIQEQFDILYHKGVAGLKARLKRTKDKYPKPEGVE